MHFVTAKDERQTKALGALCAFVCLWQVPRYQGMGRGRQTWLRWACECERWAPWLSVCRAPAGANGLAAARDFLTPVARFEERECDYTVLHKFNGQLFQSQQVRGVTAASFVQGIKSLLHQFCRCPRM